MAIKKKLNGSVDLFAKSLRQLVSEAASEGIEPHIDEVLEQMGGLENQLTDLSQSQKVLAKNVSIQYSAIHKRLKKLEK